MPLNKDLREFVESLNSNKVDYLIVGAFAVAWYGYPRFTADLDILISLKLPMFLACLTSTGQVIQLGAKPNRIDILTSVSGVSFEEAWADECPPSARLL